MESRSSTPRLDALLARPDFSDRYRTFEAVIIRLLTLEAQSQGKPFSFPAGKPGASSRYEYDLYFPQGIDDLHGPTAVEIKLFSKRSGAWTSRIGDALTRLSLNASRHGDANGLLVHTDILTVTQSRDIEAFLKQLPPSPSLKIWDAVKVEELLARHPEAIGANTDLALLPLQQELGQPESDWKARTETQLQQLRETLQTEGVTLVLGAGVSTSAKLPQWDALLGGLYVSLITKELGTEAISPEEVVALANAAKSLTDGSPLLSARYIRKGMDSGTIEGQINFQGQVSDALYQGVADDCSSSLIDAIARISQPARSGPKVKSIITYNFDDLVERSLERHGVAHHAIYASGDHATADELPILHVHGFLPRDQEKYPALDKSLLVFSEEGYHELFKMSFHWTNIVQVNAFRESACVLIGLSLTDPNLRRLLEFARDMDEKPKHVALKRRVSAEEFVRHSGRGRALARIPTKIAREFLHAHHAVEELVLRDLGVEVIWFEDFSDLPEMVQSLRTQ